MGMNTVIYALYTELSDSYFFQNGCPFLAIFTIKSPFLLSSVRRSKSFVSKLALFEFLVNVNSGQAFVATEDFVGW
jgi:hypothetical protein